MTVKEFLTEINYPDTDGLPMAESNIARDYLIYAVEVLDIYFQFNPNVYVSGNLFIYYEAGNPKAVVSPDIFVVFDVAKGKRRSYKIWEEGNKSPDFVLEITSKSTRSEDQGAKKGIYAFLGVREYFQYDPTGEYLNTQIQGLRLVEDYYLPIAPIILPDGTLSINSEVLGLELRVCGGELRFYDIETGQKLLSHRESEQARIEVKQALQAEIQARQEAELRSQLLAAKLRELGIDPDKL